MAFKESTLLSLLIRRFGQSILVVLVVGLIAFALFRYVGDPINNMLGQEATPEERDALRGRLGLDQPFVVQFYDFMKNMASGNFGISYRLGRPVSELIAERLPATVELSVASGLFAFLFGVWMGATSAVAPRSFVSRTFMMTSLLGMSLPPFFVGILLIMLFAVTLGWLPSFGRGEVTDLGFWTTGLLTWSGIKALILPAITLGLFQLTLIMRLVRSQMLEVLHSDYIKFARARGLPESRIIYRHAIKNTLVPIITVTGLQLGSILAFSIITETVFQWPGLGLLFIQAVHFGDIPIMATYLMLVSVMFVSLNFVCDILYVLVDPRLQAADPAAAGA